jgi:hypothetical protein
MSGDPVPHMGEKTTSAATSTILADIFNVVLLHCEPQYYCDAKGKGLVWDSGGAAACP